jgi:ElaA protein
MHFTCTTFSELTTEELYTILQVRAKVFVVEQHCNYLDCDNLDKVAYHLCGFQDNQLVAYCRLLPKGSAYVNYCSIGRVLTIAEARSKGFGKNLMEEAIRYCKQIFNENIKIGAQAYLENFYTELGFVSTDHKYEEDEIPHISMLLLWK